ncbi:hypothetical protein CBR_g3866 [Chara braunii]|uniref:Uncharacterized protein n=1 Tax=Chara braunii TaxID=69332 RepID=A0A388KGL4_CHABU|nr:hypothetical protein CBR_g3866 [Chara braunii]|eukprot:GBG69166.1 hypothetical protein CBR_g3866 [Chara braunii]
MTDEEDEGRKSAVPPLKELCLIVIIENLDYVEDVGYVDDDLAYEIFQHATWEQLLRIENASKGRDFVSITDGLWRNWFERKWGRDARADVEERMEEEGYAFGWRHIFEEKLRLDEEQAKEGVARLRELYMEAHSAKRVRSLQVCDKVPPGRKRGKGAASWGSTSGSSGRFAMPKIGERGRLLKKARMETETSQRLMRERSHLQQQRPSANNLHSSMARHANAMKMQAQLSEALQIPSFAQRKTADPSFAQRKPVDSAFAQRKTADAGRRSAPTQNPVLPPLASKRHTFQEEHRTVTPVQKKAPLTRQRSPISTGSGCGSSSTRSVSGRMPPQCSAPSTPRREPPARQGLTSCPLGQAAEASSSQVCLQARQRSATLTASSQDSVKPFCSVSLLQPCIATTSAAKTAKTASAPTASSSHGQGMKHQIPVFSSKLHGSGELAKPQGGGGGVGGTGKSQGGGRGEMAVKMQRGGTTSRPHAVGTAARAPNVGTQAKPQGLGSSAAKQQQGAGTVPRLGSPRGVGPVGKQQGSGFSSKPQGIKAASGGSRR